MAVRATMTLSMFVERKLWGIVSFHNRTPKIPSVEFRQIAALMAPIINTKIAALQDAQLLAMYADIDALAFEAMEKPPSIQFLLNKTQTALDKIKNQYSVDGMALGLEGEFATSDVDIALPALEGLQARARSEPGGI